MSHNYKDVKHPKKVGDWVGKKVMSLRIVSNALGKVPAGIVFTISSATFHKRLETDPCECCGLAFRATVKATAKDFLLGFKFVEEVQP